MSKNAFMPAVASWNQLQQLYATGTAETTYPALIKAAKDAKSTHP